ncbi:hypothetical protein, conserved [Babesia bigemina]|uniref:Uncharacterized protein n=1 Tax=Babesia bigemina TaxID=5866 RepID=A0A061DAV8_BABBI|nr:hypothetical protein, conserved [Babesia bigemina]CDR96059.1 hypothetical protein, conserved [Babesia bigemina]|eukprot:XP_012768245.1 hypothetical protein, conserved [Babesia bigemina]
MVNSYGGSFIGFQAIREGASGGNDKLKKVLVAPKVPEGPPEVLVIDLRSATNINLPETKPPVSTDFVITAFFDDETVEEAFKHMRQSCKPTKGVYCYDSYTCQFDQQIVLPCAGKKHVVLYVSYVTIITAPDGSRDLDLKGYGLTKPIPLDSCGTVPIHKEQLLASNGTDTVSMALTYSVKMAKSSDSDQIPPDTLGGLVLRPKIKFL